MDASSVELSKTKEFTPEPEMPSNVDTNEVSMEKENTMLHLADLRDDEPISSASTQRKATDELMSMASIETQPPMLYNNFNNNLYPTGDYPYDTERPFSQYGNFYNGCYGLDNSWPYNCGSQMDSMQMMNSQLSFDSQSSSYQYDKKAEEKDVERPPAMTDEQNEELMNAQQSLIDSATNKVVAINPVILVDKVERSLIVQWHENGIKREQRISYKKYGNAKAQQRAESLIAKLMSGSTFDQLYPEKGPPILTIFENVGDYKVSLTRDRIKREWKVEWVNGSGGKMRARWSCKKVGNEEAKKRAEAFANSLLQGKFNPRLLHKATGTRLSRNDMKYNIVVDEEDHMKQHLYMNPSAPGKRGLSKGNFERGVKKKGAKNTDGTRKKATRSSTRKKKNAMDFYPGLPNMPPDFLNYPPPGSLNGYFPMYPPDCDSKHTMLGSSYDSFPGTLGDVMNPDMQNWNNPVPNMDFSVDWDFTDPSMDYGSYNPMFDVSQSSYMDQMDWMRNGCMVDYMTPPVEGPMTTTDLSENPTKDTQSISGHMYPFFGEDSSICYTDSMFPADHMGLSGSYFDMNFMTNEASNSQSQCSYMVPTWQEEESKVVENSQTLNPLPSANRGDAAQTKNLDRRSARSNNGDAIPPQQMPQDPSDGDIDLSRAPTIIPMAQYGHMNVVDVHADQISYQDEYPINTMPTMYASDTVDYNNHTVANPSKDVPTEFFKGQLNMPEMQDFYLACKAPIDDAATKQDPPQLAAADAANQAY